MRLLILPVVLVSMLLFACTSLSPQENLRLAELTAQATRLESLNTQGRPLTDAEVEELRQLPAIVAEIAQLREKAEAQSAGGIGDDPLVWAGGTLAAALGLIWQWRGSPSNRKGSAPAA